MTTPRDFRIEAKQLRKASAGHRAKIALYEKEGRPKPVMDADGKPKPDTSPLAQHTEIVEALDTLAGLFERCASGELVDPRVLEKASVAADRPKKTRFALNAAVHDWLVATRKSLLSCECDTCKRKRKPAPKQVAVS